MSANLHQFLEDVEKKHMIHFCDLMEGISKAFNPEEQRSVGSYLEDCLCATEEFDHFLKEYEFKDVNVCAVVLYLKLRKLEVSEQIRSRLSDLALKKRSFI